MQQNWVMFLPTPNLRRCERRAPLCYGKTPPSRACWNASTIVLLLLFHFSLPCVAANALPLRRLLSLNVYCFLPLISWHYHSPGSLPEALSSQEVAIACNGEKFIRKQKKDDKGLISITRGTLTSGLDYKL